MTDLFGDQPKFTRRYVAHRLDEIIAQLKTYGEADSKRALRLLLSLRKEIGAP